jgi:quercetin dioxygenase-like cupin family protein
VNTLLTKQLPEGPGTKIQVSTINYAPGAVDAIHRHDAHAVVYVLDGEVEMQVRGRTLRRFGPGQVFDESPGDVHTVSRNASKTKPAKFVAFFINLDPAFAAREAAIGLLAASGCRKSACHPEGDLRRSWKSLAANAEQGAVAA